jgi:hypothetical protein
MTMPAGIAKNDGAGSKTMKPDRDLRLSDLSDAELSAFLHWAAEQESFSWVEAFLGSLKDMRDLVFMEEWLEEDERRRRVPMGEPCARRKSALPGRGFRLRRVLALR